MRMIKLSKIKNTFEVFVLSMKPRLDILQASKNFLNMLEKLIFLSLTHFLIEQKSKVWFKSENLQYTGSFKVRGAFNKILKLSLSERKKRDISCFYRKPRCRNCICS